MSTAPSLETPLAALAERAAAGDAEAFSQLVVATSPTIFALALRLVGNEHDARDVVQETYLRAYRSIGRFRAEAAISTWLYRICANCASSHLSRRRTRSAEVLHDDATLPDLTTERDLRAVESSHDDRDRLVLALGQLAPALRAVVVLHDIYDLGHEAISAELGISRAASKVRLHRARRRLRELLFVPPERADVPGGSPAGAALVKLDARRTRAGSRPQSQLG